MSKRIRVLSTIVVGIFLLQVGCATSDDPNKRKNRALMGGATSTALGVATGVGGPILLARAALGATSRVATGEAMDKMKDKNKGEEETKPKIEDEETVEKTGNK